MEMEWVAVLKKIKQEAKEKANGKTLPSEHSQRLIFFPNDWQDRDGMALPFGNDARKKTHDRMRGLRASLAARSYRVDFGISLSYLHGFSGLFLRSRVASPFLDCCNGHDYAALKPCESACYQH